MVQLVDMDIMVDTVELKDLGIMKDTTELVDLDMAADMVELLYSGKMVDTVEMVQLLLSQPQVGLVDIMVNIMEKLEDTTELVEVDMTVDMVELMN